MVGTTLREIRHHIERLASDDGEYSVICARSGERPVPVAGQWFATRPDAVDAAHATEQYRAALRRYDPQLPCYDPIVHHDRAACADTNSAVNDNRPTSNRHVTNATPQSVADRAQRDRNDTPLISFCHDVSGAVFETLSARDHDVAERAIMETYLAAAEATTDRNTLCLVLLETMASELGCRLDATERTQLLRAAAAKLSPVDPADDPVAASLDFLDSLSLMRAYGVTRDSDGETGGNVWTVSLRGYAIECGERRFPTLPIGIDILRRTASPTAALGVTDVTALGDGDWQFVVTNDEERTGGLVCTPGERR